MRDATRIVRAGRPAPEQGRPFLPGPEFAAPFHLRGDPASSEYGYGRDESPTWSAYERALAELEGGEVVLFGSGMAAATAVLLSGLGPGDALTLPTDCYMHVRDVASEHLERIGVEVTRLPTAAMAVRERVDLLWLESPSNPGLDVCDIRALAATAHERGGLVAVDNTLATPLRQRPLALGADLSVTSATKHLSGHADLLLGYVAARDAELAGRLRTWRSHTGSIAGPFETWLAHRSLATLDVRLERSEANALALARMLHGRVGGLRYPGLPTDPAHELARGQMSGFGTVLCFDLGSSERAQAFLDSAELVTEATSFGGVMTTAERRARWALRGDLPSAGSPRGDDVPEGFIRLSAGCEAEEDLLADVDRALP